MPPKLTKDSEAIKTLTAWFSTGKLTDKDKPKDVHQAHDLFRQYKLDTFRARFNDVKREHKRNRDCIQEDDEQDLDRRCSMSVVGGRKKGKLIEAAIESDREDDDDDVFVGGEELVSDDLTFKPLFLLSNWKEPHTMTKRVSIAIVLPSGVGVGEFSIRVVDSGEYLELTVVWPSPLLEMEVLHKKWLNDQNNGFALYHPKVVGFKQALRQLRSRTSEHIESTARISLPFRVQPRIENKYNLSWRGSNMRMLYVDLVAAVEDYALVKDYQEFEEV